MSDRQHICWVSDPRHPGTDACLGAYFTILSPGSEPSGYGEHFDPGAGAEIKIDRLQIGGTSRPAAILTTDQYHAVEAEILDRFDFGAAARDERLRDDL